MAATQIATIIVIYLVVRFLIFKLIRRLVDSVAKKASEGILHNRKARIRALQSVMLSAVGFVLAFITGMMVLEAAGVKITSLLMGAGVAGLAVGFGAQKLVRDIINGFFILMEDQYGIGEYVTIGAVSGVVEELGLRITRVRDSAGKLYIISNGDIGQVCNHSRGVLRVSHDVAVPFSVDLDKAGAVLDELGREIAAEMPELIREPFACEGLAQVSATTATIRLVGGVTAHGQDEVLLALNGRVKQAFEKNGLTLA